MGANGQGMPGDLLAADDGATSGKKGPLGKETLMGLGVLIIAVIGYILLKAKKR